MTHPRSHSQQMAQTGSRPRYDSEVLAKRGLDVKTDRGTRKGERHPALVGRALSTREAHSTPVCAPEPENNFFFDISKKSIEIILYGKQRPNWSFSTFISSLDFFFFPDCIPCEPEPPTQHASRGGLHSWGGLGSGDRSQLGLCWVSESLGRREVGDWPDPDSLGAPGGCEQGVSQGSGLGSPDP